jgi:nucleotide-binding universal stress UspA family protein
MAPKVTDVASRRAKAASHELGSILVHAETGAAGEQRIRLAARLARRFDSALIGMAAGQIRPDVYAGMAYAGVATAGLIDYEQKAIDTEIRQAAELFLAVGREEGPTLEWRGRVGFPADIFAHEARAADLIVVGQPGRDAVSYFQTVDAGDLLMQAGRPVMVAPPGLVELPLRKAIVAWSDTREARRAVADAIGLLRAAANVRVCEFAREHDRTAAEARLKDVQAYLRRHDIAAEIDFNVGTAEEDLFAYIEVSEADLVVAGAYGHTRFREWILGGVTRALLRESAVCCALSH